VSTKRTSSKPSPCVEMSVAGQDSQQTWFAFSIKLHFKEQILDHMSIIFYRPQYFDTDPVFEQGFVFMVVNPHSDDLHIKVLDTGHKNTVIGNVVIRMSDLLNQPG